MLGVLVLGAVVGLVEAGLGARDAQRASASLTAAQAGGSPAQAAAAVRSAQVQVRSADDHLSRLPVRALAAVPVLGRSVRAERALVVAARDTLDLVAVATDALPTLRAANGGVRLDALPGLARGLQARAPRAARSLRQAEAVPLGLTPPPVPGTVRRALAQLRRVQSSMGDAAEGALLAPGLLGGEGTRSLLVAVQNNAELRASGGYASSFATGSVRDGVVQIGRLRGFQEVRDQVTTARRVPAPPAFSQDYGVFKADTTLLTGWGMGPDVPSDASVLAEATGEVLGTPPADVVLLLDVPALSGLAGLTGGVKLPDGSTASPDELGQALLVDAYAQAGSGVAAQVRRRAALRDAASAVLGSLLSPQVPAVSALRELGVLAAGRHLALWSARPEEQARLVQLGFAGHVDGGAGDLLCVSINSLAADKLDQYAERTVGLDVVLGQDRAEVTQTVTVVNRTPLGLVPYVAGSGAAYGRLDERLELDVPTGAKVIALDVDGRPARATVHPGPPRTRVSTALRLDRGRSTTVLLRYLLPVSGGRYRATLVPQALYRDAQVHAQVHAADGRELEQDAALSGPFSATRTLRAALVPTGGPLLDRVERFLRRPVRFRTG